MMWLPDDLLVATLYHTLLGGPVQLSWTRRQSMRKRESAERILLRVTEAADLVGLSRSTIYNLVTSGQLDTVRVGRTIRVPVSALEKWVEQKRGATGLTSDER
jgi:excisionase family DNA binding protein